MHPILLRHARLRAVPIAASSLLLFAALQPLGAQAAMSWLLPNTSVTSGKDPVVSVDSALSEDLFLFTRGVKLDTVRITGPDGADVEVENRSSARHRDSFDFKLAKTGTYRISNVSRSMMASYKQGSEAKRFRGSPEAFAKEVPADAEVTSAAVSVNRQVTFVSKEEPGQASFTAEGVGLELLPLGPVTDLSNGDTSRLRLLLDGKPYADATIKLMREGNRYRYKAGDLSLKSDAKGEFTIDWTEPGRYWLGVTYDGRPPAAAGAAANIAPSANPNATTGTAAPVAPEPGGPGGRAGGTRQAPLQRASLSATFEVLPK